MSDKFLYRPVIHDFTFMKYDEEGNYEGGETDLSAKRFSIEKLYFDSEEGVEEFLKEENEFEPDGEMQDEIQFINGEQNDEDPDYDFYEQGDGDWDTLNAFRTFEEAENLRNDLVEEYKKSENKETWYPSH